MDRLPPGRSRIAAMKTITCTLSALLLISVSSPAAAPFIVAHRGASGDAPENTLPAFERAWKQGADAIEGDFHLTADGKIVCFHDKDTGKITGNKRVIARSTFADLSSLDVGTWKGARFTGTRIPLLSQVLATVSPGKKIYIEIKCGPEIVPPLLAEMAKSRVTDGQVVIISFNEKVIAAVKRARPQWTANWLYGFNTKDTSAPGKELPRLLEILRDCGADGLGSNAQPGLQKSHLASLSAAGFQHHVWTVNDASDARRFLELGSRSVTTDYPGRLREELSRD